MPFPAFFPSSACPRPQLPLPLAASLFLCASWSRSLLSPQLLSPPAWSVSRATQQFPPSLCRCHLATTLCDPAGCVPPGSSVDGILQTRTLEWVAIPFSREILLTQGPNPHLLHWQMDSLPLSHQGSHPVTKGGRIKLEDITLLHFKGP